MRPLFFLLPAPLLLLAASSGAQTLPYPPSDAPAMSTVQVSPPGRTVRIRDEQARHIAGTYAMSNGWYLQVRPATRHIDATIDDRQPLRLFAVGPYRFASRDGNVAMEFNRGSMGEDMLMSYRPDPRLAQVIVLSAPMAQR